MFNPLIKSIAIALVATALVSCGSDDITEYTDTYQIKACGDLSESIGNVEDSLEGNYQLAHAMAVRTVEHDCVNELDQIVQTGFDINYVQGSQTILDVAKFNQNNPTLIISYLESKGAKSPYFDKRDADSKARDAKMKAKRDEKKRKDEEKAAIKAERDAKNAEKKAEYEAKKAEASIRIAKERDEKAEERRISKLPKCDQIDERLLKESITTKEAFNKVVVDNCPKSVPMVVGLLAAEGLTSLPEVSYKNWDGDAAGFAIRSKRPELAKALIDSQLFDKKAAVVVLDSYIEGGVKSYFNTERIAALTEYVKLGYLDFNPEYTKMFVQKAYLGGHKSVIKILSEAYYKPEAKGDEFGLKNFRLGADFDLYKGTRGFNCPDTAEDGYYLCSLSTWNSNSSSIFGISIERIDLTFIENRLARIQMYIEHSSRQYAKAPADDQNFQTIIKGLKEAYGEDLDKTSGIGIWKNGLQQRIQIAHNVHVGTIQASGRARAYNIIKDKEWHVNVMKIEDDKLMKKLPAITKRLANAEAIAEEKAEATELAKHVAYSGGKGNLAKFNGLEIGKPVPAELLKWARCNGSKESEDRTDYKGNEPRAKECIVHNPNKENKNLGKNLKADYIRTFTLDGLLTQMAFIFEGSRFYDYSATGLTVLKVMNGEGELLPKDKYEKSYWHYVPNKRPNENKARNVIPSYWSKDGVVAAYGYLYPTTMDKDSYSSPPRLVAYIVADTTRYIENRTVYRDEKRAKEKAIRDAKKAKKDAEAARKAADF